MPIVSSGALDLDATVSDADEALADPALDVLLDFLKTMLNARAGQAWALAVPGAGSVPVRSVFAYDPRDGGFNAKDLPALYLWRTEFDSAQVCDDVQIGTTKLHLLWIFPRRVQKSRVGLSRFINRYRSLIDGALAIGRDPSWVSAGDTDPNAATEGSFVWDIAGLAHIGPAKTKPDTFAAEGGDDTADYNAVSGQFEIEEELKEGGFSEIDGIDVTMTTEDDDAAVTEEFALD